MSGTITADSVKLKLGKAYSTRAHVRVQRVEMIDKATGTVLRTVDVHDEGSAADNKTAALRKWGAPEHWFFRKW